MTARAALVLTGDELLRGFIQDANAAHIAASLRHDGIQMGSIRVAGDSIDAITHAVQSSIHELGHVDLVILSGGLGPTHDDRTSEAVSKLAGRALELQADALVMVEARLRTMGRLSTADDHAMFDAGNRKQATMAAGSIVLHPAGTAPGYVVPASEGSPIFVVLPGPPGELRHAWEQVRTTAPYRELMEQSDAGAERLVRIWGVPESYAARALEDAGHVDSAACHVTLCARDGELELSIRGTDSAQVDARIDALCERFGTRVFALDDERSIAQLVGEQVHRAGCTMAVAESCTGGLLGSMLTGIPGSSSWFVGGAIVYSNELKEQFAGVAAQTLQQFGAVSEQTARELAIGIRTSCGSDIGIGITGVAGPGGGTEEKPVGTVFVGIADEAGVDVMPLRLYGGRATIRLRSCIAALHGVRQRLAAAHDGIG